MPVLFLLSIFGWVWRGFRRVFGPDAQRFGRWAAVQLGPKADVGAKLEAAHLERDLAGSAFAPVRLLIGAILALIAGVLFLILCVIPEKNKRIASTELRQGALTSEISDLRAQIVATSLVRDAAIAHAKNAVEAVSSCESRAKSATLAAAERDRERNLLIARLRKRAEGAKIEVQKSRSGADFDGAAWLRDLSPAVPQAPTAAPADPATASPGSKNNSGD